jgi:hypothetical protein
MRYLLSLIIPVPMRSTHAQSVKESDIAAGGHGNHFRSDDHHDLVHGKWWQWRGRTFAYSTVHICIA